jgi:hypothetical protein
VVTNGLDVTIAEPSVDFDDGRDRWIGAISFELPRQCLWRLNIRFTTREARLLTAYATGISPNLLTVPVIHSCIKEMLNTIAGPIKHAALNAMGQDEAMIFRPMLPRVEPAFDLGQSENVIGLAVDRFGADFLGGKVEFECLWSDTFPQQLIDDRTRESGELEFL